MLRKLEIIDLHTDKMQEILDDISNKYGDGIIIPASLKNSN